MKHRDRIMGNIGSLLDNVEYLLCQLERQENHGTVDETDKEFMADLNRVRPELVKFYYSWEERY
jgi:hypothetical protein